MESPHEREQGLLLARIIANVEKLNESILVLNRTLQEINVQNMDVELVAQMFKNYQSNVLFNLEGESFSLSFINPVAASSILFYSWLTNKFTE
ncbi:DASH complex subunit Dad4-domain-containing protein [Kalaharituber pfeilii]|nr:DASH complex subunit Dad4-domain-containing protein [Kalaharituber pfeilii]